VWLQPSRAGKTRNYRTRLVFRTKFLLVCLTSFLFITSQIKRNAVSFPACRVYLSFPVWTKESLVGAQVFKKQVQATRRTYNEEKNDALAKYQAASNIVAKGLLYHAAAQAYEKASTTPNINHIPDDGDLIELADGLCMSKKGTVWNREFGLGYNHQALGFATVSLCDTEP
jgi:hypothetical protein